MKYKPYEPVGDDWFQPRHRRWKLQCCDCGLVHVIDFKIIDDGIWMRMGRDERATSAVRRAFNLEKDDE